MLAFATSLDESGLPPTHRLRLWRIVMLALASLFLNPKVVRAQDLNPLAPASFEQTIVPILSQYGCNAASCHGAAGGRGGFELSLFGARPKDDYQAIVFAEQGRRIQMSQPTASLLLAKPTASIDHEGDMRFDVGSEPFERIKSWIEQGARYGEPLEVSSIEVEPSVIRDNEGVAESELRVWATLQDGSRVDVTSDVVFEVEDPASVSLHENIVTSSRPGEHRVFARYDGVYDVVCLIVPYSSEQTSRSFDSSIIDRELSNKLHELGLQTAPEENRAALIRRMYLDLAGRLPSEDEARSSLADQRPDAIHRLSERLLASPDFESVWTYHLARWLDADGLGDPPAAHAFRSAIRDSIANDIAWSELVDQMTQARGDSHERGVAGFYRGTSDPRIQAERFSEQILGTRLRCANCHDHPLDRWTQDDYHGLAAIFARVSQNRNVVDRPTGEVIHPRTQTVAITKLPGVSAFDPSLTTQQLADWLNTNPEAAWQRDAVQVNRAWSVLMGRGLVHPIDDWRATNPATHPALLAHLISQFQNDASALKPLIRRIVLSQAYQRSSQPSAIEMSDEQSMRWHARRVRTPLSPELLLDAIVSVTEVPEQNADGAILESAIELEQRIITSPSLTTLGRCAIGSNCGPSSTASSTRDLRQGLHWINGPLLNRRLEDPSGWLMRSWSSSRDAEDWLTHSLDSWYLRCFTRPATQEERTLWRDELTAASNSQEAQQILIDLAWATLASDEFWSRP